MAEPTTADAPNTHHGYGNDHSREPWYAERYTNTRGEIAYDAVYVTEAHCDICHTRGIVLVVDNSMEEYGSMTICEDCIRKGREDFERKTETQQSIDTRPI